MANCQIEAQDERVMIKGRKQVSVKISFALYFSGFLGRWLLLAKAKPMALEKFQAEIKYPVNYTNDTVYLQQNRHRIDPVTLSEFENDEFEPSSKSFEEPSTCELPSNEFNSQEGTSKESQSRSIPSLESLPVTPSPRKCEKTGSVRISIQNEPDLRVTPGPSTRQRSNSVPANKAEIEKVSPIARYLEEPPTFSPFQGKNNKNSGPTGSTPKPGPSGTKKVNQGHSGSNKTNQGQKRSSKVKNQGQKRPNRDRSLSLTPNSKPPPKKKLPKECSWYNEKTHVFEIPVEETYQPTRKDIQRVANRRREINRGRGRRRGQFRSNEVTRSQKSYQCKP